MRPPWIKLVGLLLVVWAIAGGIIYLIRTVKPSPEAVMAFVDQHGLEGRSGEERAKVVEKLALQLNQLTYEERREVRMSKKLDGFFKTLSGEEQSKFLDLTLPTGFKQMMEALNKMEPAKRKRFVNRALEDMKKRDGEMPPELQKDLDSNGQKIIDQGFRSFYSDASAETKMDVAPLIEQFQKNLQGGL